MLYRWYATAQVCMLISESPKLHDNGRCVYWLYLRCTYRGCRQAPCVGMLSDALGALIEQPQHQIALHYKPPVALKSYDKFW